MTSRLVADEWRNRHLDVILEGRGVGSGAVVVGKWLAATGFFVVLLLPTLVYIGFLEGWGAPDYPPILSAYAGAVLGATLFCAVGTLADALTPTAVAAGLASFSVLVGAQLAGGVGALEGLSFQPHLDAFSTGRPPWRTSSTSPRRRPLAWCWPPPPRWVGCGWWDGSGPWPRRRRPWRWRWASTFCRSRRRPGST